MRSKGRIEKMRDRKEIMEDSNTMIRKGHSYVGSIPLVLEVLLDIRELLIARNGK